MFKTSNFLIFRVLQPHRQNKEKKMFVVNRQNFYRAYRPAEFYFYLIRVRRGKRVQQKLGIKPISTLAPLILACV